MSDQRIPISQLSETQTAPDASYIAIDDGSLTKKITVENFNSTSTASAQQYANQAAASAQTVEDNIATSAAQIREATLAAREATQASTAATASATSAYDSASLAQNYSANAATSAGQAMNAADTVAQGVTDSKEYAEDSEAWAVGKRNGSDVPSSDDTYHNNAKYYSDNATTAATSAASDADRAEAAAESINVPDTTLTVSGVAAESKATGDRISSVNAELVDIRVKADGQTASTAGDSVREQFTTLKNDSSNSITDTVGFVNTDLFPKRITNNGANIFLGQISSAAVDGSEFKFIARGADISFGVAATVGQQYQDRYGALIPVSPGDIITVNVSGQGFAKNYVSVYNSEKECIYQSGNQWKYTFTLEMPENAAFISLRVGKQDATAGMEYTTTVSVYIDKKETVIEKIESVVSITTTRQPMGISKIRSIAHQGYTSASGYNWCKVEGYESAAKVGFSFGECDIAFSSDLIPMCSHDLSFIDSRTSEEIVIAEHTAYELQTYNFHAGKISRLDEVVHACKVYGLGLYIDHVSTTWTETMWRSVFDIIDKYGMKNNIVWLAGNPNLVSKIVAWNSGAEFAPVLTFSSIQSAVDLVNTVKTGSNKVTLNFGYSSITVDNIIALRKEVSPDVRIELYTIDESSNYELFLPYVDGITSNKLCPAILAV